MCQRSGKSAHPVSARACPAAPRTFVDKLPRTTKRATVVLARFYRFKIWIDDGYTHRQQTRFPLWSVVSWQLAVTLLPTDCVDATRIPLCITTTHGCLLTREGLFFFFHCWNGPPRWLGPAPSYQRERNRVSHTVLCKYNTLEGYKNCRYCSKSQFLSCVLTNGKSSNRLLYCKITKVAFNSCIEKRLLNKWAVQCYSKNAL